MRKHVPLDRYGGGLKRTLPFRLPTSPLAEAYDEAGARLTVRAQPASLAKLTQLLGKD